MNKHRFTIGVDPDTYKNGVALWDDRTLIRLEMMSRMEIIEEFRFKSDAIFSIENVAKSDAVFVKEDRKKSKAERDNYLVKRAISLGMVQQAQIELIRELDYYQIPYVLQDISSAWKRGNKPEYKKQAEMADFKDKTGWTKNSNDETRSAAYMGYLKVRK